MERTLNFFLIDRRLAIVLLIMICTPSFLICQYSETINSGRPGIAISGSTVGKSVVQFQSGLSRVANNSKPQAINRTSNNILRYGILENLEINAELDYSSIRFDGFTAKVNGVSNTEVGLRYNILANKSWISGLSIQARMLLNFRGDLFKCDILGHDLTLATEHKFGDKISLRTNLSRGQSDEAPDGYRFVYYSYDINVSYVIKHNIGVFAEMYGGLESLTDTYNQGERYDAGVFYLYNNNLQFDLAVGGRKRQLRSFWFVDLGFSWRYSWRSQSAERVEF